jgi:hypothetical protein
MHATGFAAPVVFKKDGTSFALMPVPLSGSAQSNYTEEWLQRLLFKHPECLPIAEIDDSFSGLIPLCMEMDTPAGPIDAVFVTPGGRLALLETKLWRNPEARREVVGQILDYAKELTNWDYSRLDTKVRQARKRAGEQFPGVAEWVAQVDPLSVAHRFQDAVSKSLGRGDYLLLVAGDGIREGVGAIAQYLDRNSSLHFTFGLVECAVYESPEDGSFYVQPRVLAQSTNLVRTVVQFAGGKILEVQDEEAIAASAEDRPDLIESRERYQRFWTELLNLLHLEESQPMPQPARSTNLYFRLPQADAWLSAYLAQSSQEAGVYLRCKNSPAGERIFDALLKDRAAIEQALGIKAEWHTHGADETQSWILIKRSFSGVLLEGSKLPVQKWLADHIERFVAVFRPRIEHLMREQC